MILKRPYVYEFSKEFNPEMGFEESKVFAEDGSLLNEKKIR